MSEVSGAVPTIWDGLSRRGKCSLASGVDMEQTCGEIAWVGLAN